MDRASLPGCKIRRLPGVASHRPHNTESIPITNQARIARLGPARGDRAGGTHGLTRPAAQSRAGPAIAMTALDQLCGSSHATARRRFRSPRYSGELRQQRLGHPSRLHGATPTIGARPASVKTTAPLGRRPPRAATSRAFSAGSGSTLVSNPIRTARSDGGGERTGMRQILCHATSPRRGNRLNFNALLGKWSGRQDSNLRPSGPKPDALPGCATPRHFFHLAPPPVGPAGFEPAT